MQASVLRGRDLKDQGTWPEQKQTADTQFRDKLMNIL